MGVQCGRCRRRCRLATQSSVARAAHNFGLEAPAVLLKDPNIVKLIPDRTARIGRGPGRYIYGKTAVDCDCSVRPCPLYNLRVRVQCPCARRVRGQADDLTRHDPHEAVPVVDAGLVVISKVVRHIVRHLTDTSVCPSAIHVGVRMRDKRICGVGRGWLAYVWRMRRSRHGTQYG